MVSVCILGYAIILATTNILLRLVGILFIAISMSWADFIAEECRRVRFFPSYYANLLFGHCFLRWEVGAILFAGLHMLSVTGVVTWLSLLDAAAVGQFWAVPFLLMRLNHYTMKMQINHDWIVVRMPKKRGSFFFPRMDEVFTMTLSSIDFEEVQEGSPKAKIAQAVSQAVEVPVYNLNQLSRSAADAVAQSLNKVKFVKDPSEVGSDDDIPIPDQKKIKRRSGEPDSIQVQLLRIVTLPMRVLSREALLWERRDLPLFACVFTILILIYFGIGHFSWLVLICFSPLLGPKSKAACALRDLQNEFGKMYGAMEYDRKGNQILRPPLWSVINMPMVFYFTLIHSLSLLGLWAVVSPASWVESTGIQAPTTFTIVSALMLWPITAFGITGGVHRLWAHRSYQANFTVWLVLMLLNSMANQGSIFHWARDHRVHHLYSDSEVKHPNPEINTKWRNNCSKLRNNHENMELLQKKE
jgi:hypothetical protein